MPSASWLNAQYNVRERVPEHPAIFARWAADSAAAREQRARRLDVHYGHGPSETLDLFVAPRANAPVLVFIHGGWWRALDKADHAFIAPALVDAGALVVVPNYALAPAAPLEAIVLQMTHALVWTWRHAALYGGDPGRIVVAGHSAGAHLAAMLLQCRWKLLGRELPARLVQSVLAISGVYELESIRRTPYLQADLNLTPKRVARLSPAWMPAPAAGTLHAVVGALESEEFQRQNRLVRQAWGARRVPVCISVEGRHHYDILDELATPGGMLHRAALGLLGL